MPWAHFRRCSSGIIFLKLCFAQNLYFLHHCKELLQKRCHKGALTKITNMFSLEYVLRQRAESNLM